jgi:hypothetical protein
MRPSCCSHAHQSLFVLLPSTWWAAVALPHKNPDGKLKVALGIFSPLLSFD